MISREEHCGNYTVVTISDTGSAHRALLIPNQDDVGYCFEGDDFVVAVSDGVGSCKKSDIGSQCAVKVCIDLFKKIKSNNVSFTNEQIIEYIITSWYASLSGNCIDECCATLKSIIKIGNIAKIISIGDGFAAISSAGLSVISPIEYVDFTNETNCLSSFVSARDMWVNDFVIDFQKSYTAICCTDGISSGILQGKEKEFIDHIEKYSKACDLRMEIESLMREISNYSFDDKTVGVVKYEFKN